jgi:hypothetical protein
MAHDCKIVGAVRDKGFLIRRHQRRVLVQNVLPSFTLFFRASRDTCRVIALNLPASISYKFSSIWLLIIGSVSSGEIYLWPLIAAEHVVILRLAHWPKARITCKFFRFSIFETRKLSAHKEIMRHENLVRGRIPKALYALSKFTPRLKFQVARLQANVAVSVNDKSERQTRCSGSDVDIYCVEISGSHHVPYHYVCKSSPIISLDLSLTKLVFPLRKTALPRSLSLRINIYVYYARRRSRVR